MSTTTNEQILADFIELDLDQGLIDEGSHGEDFDRKMEIVTKFVSQKLDLVREETAKEIVEQLDELEMNQPEDLKTDNWRNWKYIRNAIVDKYQIINLFRSQKKTT